jgi:hypothetical protein
MIRVVCACGRAFKAEDRHAGRHTKCPECGADLTIGPAPKPSSGGADAGEVPAWWYPSDAAARATAPTRSGSDPGADAVNTMVLPPRYDPKSKREVPSQSPSAAGGIKAQVSPAKAAVVAPTQVSGHSFFPAKKLWAISGGIVAFLLLAVGTIFWPRSASPVVDAVGPVRQGPERPNSELGNGADG